MLTPLDSCGSDEPIRAIPRILRTVTPDRHFVRKQIRAPLLCFSRSVDESIPVRISVWFDPLNDRGLQPFQHERLAVDHAAVWRLVLHHECPRRTTIKMFAEIVVRSLCTRDPVGAAGDNQL